MIFTRPDWQRRNLVREALRNVSAWGSRAFLGLAVSVLLSSMGGVFAASEVSSYQDSLSDLGARGRNIVVVTSGDPNSVALIGRNSCEHLTTIDGVARAGVIVDGERIDIVPLGSAIRTYFVSPTLIPAVLDSDALVGSALDSAPPGATRGITVGSEILRARVGATQPAGVEINSGVAFPATPSIQTALVCIIVLEPNAVPELLSSTLVSSLRSSGAPLASSVVLPESTDVREAFLVRSSRYLPFGLGVVLGILFGLIAIGRSSELASYRLSGTSTFTLMTILWFEALLVGGACAASTTLTSIIMQPSGQHVVVGALSGLVTAGTLVGVATLISLALAARKPTDMAKDR